jgi:predicted negative regulator of RcsB-dependent stress response
MTFRLIIAYSLIALMVLAAVAVVCWNVYHSSRRTDARRRARQAEYFRKRDESLSASERASASE